MTSAAGIDEMGPIDYLVIEFPAGRPPDGSALPVLRDLVGRGIIRVLNLAFLRKEGDGSLTGIDIADIGLDCEASVALFAEETTGVLDDGDLREAGAALHPGRSAAVLIYENTWAAPLSVALRRNGAETVAAGRIPVEAILTTLDSLDDKN
ncbi:hypothetical protein J2W56_001718 [Nocardia kruczakiae]|jgi:hypothetical protein|uniref:DUF1269 domain-containing protein n=1 Tax=Nocardia kruczakiae TaxID=261477 RepID=A0ABU1XBT6_9NOCA|nr:DUF6325 family protein [Nocardia kruczakiae]MDR7167999.1 hypothetical protein [Nocardia kruczakiae]